MISIIVPIKNAEKSLFKCLHSIKNQTFRHFEVILVNYGLIDKSGEICEKFASNDSRFHVIHLDSTNASRAKNIGLAYAQGEYVCFVNAVDWINAEMLEEFINTNKIFQGDIVTCRYFEDSISELFLTPGPDENKIMSKNEAIQLCLSQPRVNSFLGNKLYKLELFSSSPAIHFDEDIEYYEDLLVAMQLFDKSQRIVYSPPPHYHYYLNRHLPLNVLQNKRKLDGLIAIERAVELLSKDPSVDTRILKDLYIKLTLSSLFTLLTLENVDSPFINELRKKLHTYNSSELKDSDLKKCCRITRRNAGLGKIYWDMFYKKKLVE